MKNDGQEENTLLIQQSKKLCFETEKITFHSGFSEAQMLKIISKADLSELKNDFWRLYDNKWKNILDLFKHIRECRVKKFAITHCSDITDKKFGQIFSKKYEKLIQLILVDVRITSFEAITFIDAPLLQFIKTKDNFVTQISNVVNKMIFPHLRQIGFHQRHVREFNATRCLSRQPSEIQYQILNRDANIVVQDVSFLAKLSFRLKKQISINPLSNYFVDDETKDTKKSYLLQPKVVIALFAKVDIK